MIEYKDSLTCVVIISEIPIKMVHEGHTTVLTIVNLVTKKSQKRNIKKHVHGRENNGNIAIYCDIAIYLIGNAINQTCDLSNRQVTLSITWIG